MNKPTSSNEPSKPSFRVLSIGDKITLVLEGLSIEDVQKLQAEFTQGIVEAIQYKFNATSIQGGKKGTE